MKYLGDTFSVFPGGNKAYRDNYDEIFGKKKKDEPKFDMEPVDIPPAPPELEQPKKAPKKAKKKNEKNKKK